MDIASKTEEIIKIVKNCESIPTLRAIHAKISNILADKSDISLHKLSNIVKIDVSLTARILRIVNSPFYGFANRITSIENAIVLLGFNTVKSILISSYIYEDTEVEKRLKGLWEHSLFSAMTARSLSKNIPSSDKPDQDYIFATGLIHDIGRVVIVMSFPDEAEKTLKKKSSRKISLSDIEKETFGINHDTLGSMLLREWNFPKSIYIPVNHHHSPLLSNSFKVESAILNISDILTNAIGIGILGEECVEPIDQKCLDFLSVDDKFLRDFIYEIYPFKEELSIFK